MTGGFAVLPVAENGGEMHGGSHLAGVSRILGPRLLQLPTLTVGLLGVQVLWSVEMSYGAQPHLSRSYLHYSHRSPSQAHLTLYLLVSQSLL